MKEKVTQKREGQRKMTKKRNIKTENTFSVLQDEDTELILKEEKQHLIDKINKNKKKSFEGKGRGRIRKI